MTALMPLRETCILRPREQTSEEYAADLHKALNGEIRTAAATADFFAGTYVTAAMRRVATGIFDRLRHGSKASQPAIIRFNSMFGGGKTHTLIALAAVAKHPQLVRSNATEGLMPADLAVDGVKLVCFNGEDANLLDGMTMDGTNRQAKSLTGFLAYHLAGETAFDEVQRHDELFSHPGAARFERLIGDKPTLILLDELVHWVAATKQLENDADRQRAADGLRNTLNAICKAVANSPHAVLVITTPEEGHDAYREETQFVHNAMNNLDSVTARVARDFTPTETETSQPSCADASSGIRGATTTAVMWPEPTLKSGGAVTPATPALRSVSTTATPFTRKRCASSRNDWRATTTSRECAAPSGRCQQSYIKERQ